LLVRAVSRVFVCLKQSSSKISPTPNFNKTKQSLTQIQFIYLLLQHSLPRQELSRVGRADQRGPQKENSDSGMDHLPLGRNILENLGASTERPGMLQTRSSKLSDNIIIIRLKSDH
jgi:hypothetical protein